MNNIDLNLGSVPAASSASTAPLPPKSTSFFGRAWTYVKSNVALVIGMIVSTLLLGAGAVYLYKRKLDSDRVQSNLNEESTKTADKVQTQFERKVPNKEKNGPLTNAGETQKVKEQVIEIFPGDPSAPDFDGTYDQTIPGGLGSIQISSKKTAATGLCALGGIANGGDTCYMASVIRSLFVTPGFVEKFIENGKGMPLKQKEDESKEAFGLRTNLHYLYQITQKGTNISGTAMNVTRVFSMDAGWKNRTSQDDAASFCQFIFDTLKVPKFTSFQAVYMDNDPSGLPAVYPGAEGNKLSLMPLLPKKNCELNELFNNEFTEKDTTNALFTMRMSEADLPPVLPVHLKRFSQVINQKTKVVTNEKTKDPIKFSDPLDVPLAFDRDLSALYNLSSIVVHKGNTVNSGHYYTYAKETTLGGKERWVKFDDLANKGQGSICSDADVEVDVRENGYLFFYNNTGVTLSREAVKK